MSAMTPMTRPFVARRRPLSLASLAALGALAVLAHASARGQEAGTGVDANASAAVGGKASGSTGGRKGLSVTPRVSVTETWTDNLTLAPDGARDKAFITAISPGITINSNSGWLRGVFDYTLDGLIYTKSPEKSRVQNQLNTKLTGELVPQALFVDVTGNISQQSMSAFGQQSPSSQLDSPNRTETRTLQVSPYWRGTLGQFATFELRASGQIRDSSDGGTGLGTASSGDSKEGQLSLNLRGPQGRTLNWGLSATTQRVHYDQTGVDNRTSTALGSLYWIPDVDWTLGVNAGVERSDYFGKDTTAVYGVNFRWTPTPRTRIDGDWQRHSYGNSHLLSLEHRMSQISLRAVNSQSVVTANTPSGLGTNYQLLDQQFQASEPDPVKRDQLVRQLLALMGLSPDAITGNGFISNAASLQRRTEVSVAYNGQRLTATLSGSDSTSSRLGLAPTGTGDLSLTDRLRMRGASVALGYRLTPLSTASVSYTRQHSSGDGVGSTDMKSLQANVAIRLGPRTDANLGLRHTTSTDKVFVANLGGSGYRENALFASLSQRF
ncbi:TIGR03016 family PEP-CTERM system-associated outer membrane protein [Roseateles sp.]|uniref:TIGR03016 family PEP-CTERM system-associated outer membrane protein n=1 Tax=Roseateles sp. TaxID=1971397 RepID=UPI0031CE405C